MSRVTHWPEDGGGCTCGFGLTHSIVTIYTSTPLAIAALREHLRVWCFPLRKITFKQHETENGEPYWISETVTPMHSLIARPDHLNPNRYRIRCQCGWSQRIPLPLKGANRDLYSPGRQALVHIREVIEGRLVAQEEKKA